MDPLVIHVEEPEQPEAERLFTASPVEIGRSRGSDLRLPYPFVSARHAVVEFSEGDVRYTDLGSTNGSVLDGRRLEAGTPARLPPGARISIGRVRLTFSRRARPGLPEGQGDAPPEPGRIRPGGLTALLQRLAGAPVEDAEAAWREVLFPGAVVDRFELVQELGRGAFGIVYEAVDRRLRRHVAFKAVRPGAHSRVLLRQEQLQREAEAVAQLNHPNIVSLYDAGTCEHGPYLILELLRGATLQARLAGGPLAAAEALDVAVAIASALAHAHAAGVVHRDLKPANVFLCEGGATKVLDFGIAHVFGAGDPELLGTPAYMAPEQWRQGPQDARTDVYGAAAILAESLTGRLPYRVTAEWSAVLDPGAEPDLAAPGLPGSLVALLRSALSPAPGERPADGRAWLDALLAVRRAG